MLKEVETHSSAKATLPKSKKLFQSSNKNMKTNKKRKSVESNSSSSRKIVIQSNFDDSCWASMKSEDESNSSSASIKSEDESNSSSASIKKLKTKNISQKKIKKKSLKSHNEDDSDSEKESCDEIVEEDADHLSDSSSAGSPNNSAINLSVDNSDRITLVDSNDLPDRRNKKKIFDSRTINMDPTNERKLRIMATQGIVQLFSTINTFQMKTQEKLIESNTELERENVLGAASNIFLSLLKDEKSNDIKNEPQNTKIKAERKPKRSWSVFADNYYKTKPTGWDKDDSDGG